MVSRVKRDFACTLTGIFPPVLVVLRAQSRLGLEGRTRTLSGPSPDLASSVSVPVPRPADYLLAKVVAASAGPAAPLVSCTSVAP